LTHIVEIDFFPWLSLNVCVCGALEKYGKSSTDIRARSRAGGCFSVEFTRSTLSDPVRLCADRRYHRDCTAACESVACFTSTTCDSCFHSFGNDYNPLFHF